MSYNIDFRQATADAPACLTEYLNYLITIKNRSQLTALNYYTDLRMFMRFLKIKNKLVPEDSEFSKITIGDLDEKFIKNATLSDAMEFLSFTVNERSNKAKARSRKAVSLRQFYKFLTNNKAWFTASPMLNLELPSPKNALPKHLTFQECEQLLKNGFGDFSSWMDYRDYAMIVMFLNCGMRLNELVGINVNDFSENIDPSQPDLVYISVKIVGKGSKERIVYLNEQCVDALKRYTDIRATVVNPKEKALFVSKQGKRITNRRVEQIIDDRLSKCGLSGKGISVHKLRHTAATLMYQNGVDVRVLKEVLGHENLNTTQIYTHVVNKQLREAINRNPVMDIETSVPDFDVKKDDNDEKI